MDRKKQLDAALCCPMACVDIHKIDGEWVCDEASATYDNLLQKRHDPVTCEYCIDKRKAAR